MCETLAVAHGGGGARDAGRGTRARARARARAGRTRSAGAHTRKVSYASFDQLVLQLETPVVNQSYGDHDDEKTPALKV